MLLGLVAAAPAFSAPLDVIVILSNDSAPYTELADGIAAGLGQAGGHVRVLPLSAATQLEGANSDVVVAVGLKAVNTAAAMDVHAPVLAALIPKASFDKIARVQKGKSEPSAFSAVYLDQPIARQLDLIRSVMPTKKRIGVIVGADSQSLLEPLQIEARLRGLELNAVRINSEAELFPALENVLSQSDVLLSLPDSLVSSPHTIQSVLFTAYRYRVPVIGFSPAYVRAGALAAVHSTPVQIAQQVTDILRRSTPSSVVLPPPQYPDYFQVDVNQRVAHSLEIDVGTSDAIAAKLKARAKP